jgi:hypothetical protein
MWEFEHERPKNHISRLIRPYLAGNFRIADHTEPRLLFPRTPFRESLRLPDDGEGIAVITFASPQPPITRSGHESYYLRRKNLESAIVT